MRFFLAIAISTVSMMAPAGTTRPSASPATRPSSPNELVLKVARSVPDGGGYNTKWAGTGTPREIMFKGTRILGKGTDGTYCCGFTFAVAMQAADELHLLDGKSVQQIKRFQKEWYGAVPEKDLQETQCTTAVEHLGIGKSINPDDAKPGDFMQLYRSKGGHSVIFLGWVEKDGKRIGFKYRSSQGSTKGIGDNTEYFSDTDLPKAAVDRKRIYFGRFNG